MKLHPKKIEYINKKASELVEFLEETVEEKNISRDSGSMSERKVVDWSDKLSDTPYKINTIVLNEKVAVKECYKGKCIGFNEESYKEYKKLIESFAYDSSVISLVSYSYISEKAFDWFIQVNRTKKINIEFWDYLSNEIEKSIEDFKVFFPIANLDIGKFFDIGKVRFEFFTKERFKELENKYNKIHPNEKENPYKFFYEKYQGVVFATYKIRAEKEKATEIAFKECALAVDVLKICSDTTFVPLEKLSFDIESRSKELLQSSVLYQKLDKDENFTMNLIRLPSHHKIYENEWYKMNKTYLPAFNYFLNSLGNEKTELEQLIINGINRYGIAISNLNLHQRIVELFTILESLLLKDKNSMIIDSVCTYCSKLITKKVNDRKEIIAILKKMYNVRSDLIHHGKESKFEIKELQILQIIVVKLLVSLIDRKEVHKDKLSILDEIDNAILNAY